jgi:hypothetical protein
MLTYGIFSVGKLIHSTASKSMRTQYYIKTIYTKDFSQIVIKRCIDVWKTFTQIVHNGGFGTLSLNRSIMRDNCKKLIRNMLLSVWSNDEDNLKDQLTYYTHNKNPFISFISRFWDNVKIHDDNWTFDPVIVDFFSPMFLSTFPEGDLKGTIQYLKTFEYITQRWITEGSLLAALTIKVNIYTIPRNYIVYHVIT